jgi:ATP-dependent helicase/DNAse subunit B
MELSQLNVTDDSNQQGRVRVIGLLESRNMAYKLLFIPDMNDDIFPADQNKDLFLNSELRRELHLPTFADRQELQKGYMSQIIARAKSVYLSYTKSEETQPSIYLNEILTAAGHRFDDQIDEKKRSNILYRPSSYLMLKADGAIEHQSADIIKDAYMVAQLRAFKYSASSINTIKSCEYQFYYRYIESLRPAAEAVQEAGSLEIGIILHNVLERLFKQGARPQDEDYLPRMNELFEQETSKYHYFRYNKVGVYEVKAMQSNFAKMVQAERARINAGAVPKSFELREKMLFHGVQIEGRVDRLDESSNGYAIIDYKYRNYYDLRETDDFQKLDVQLPLYALIMKAKRGSYPSEILWFSLKKNPAFIRAYDPANLKQFEAELQAFFDKWFAEDIPLAGAETDRICKNCDYAGFCHKSLL